jgi:hypothetical protein
MNRHPIILKADEINKKGFIFNNKNNMYEKKDGNDIIYAVKIKDDKNDKDIFYTCDEENNKKYKHIGFLSKSDLQNQCMPCCFKKNQLLSDNKFKKSYYMNCLGLGDIEKEKEITKFNKIYILNNINKIHENKYSLLPEYLDYFFNKIMNNNMVIKKHYLLYSNTGYYFTFYPKNNNNKYCKNIYLNMLSSLLDLPIINIINNIKNKLNNNDELYMYLNNGDIKNLFNNVNDYIDYIINNDCDEYLLDDLLSIPGILSE